MKQLRFFILFLFVATSVQYTWAQCNAAFTTDPDPMKGCDPLTVKFTDKSTGAIQQRTWDFGDGSPTSGAQNPNKTFTAGKLGDTAYVVTLTIQCIGGATSTVTDTVHVYAIPKVDFSAAVTTVCALVDSVCFTNTSSSGVGFTYLWDFGDNTSSSQKNPCHEYSTGGTYDVELTVTNANGCQQKLSKSNYISVTPAPSPDFVITPFTGCEPLNVVLTNKTDTTATIITNWYWDFGDGDSSKLKNPGTHSYPTAGIYSITLSATNNLGCKNFTTQSLVVFQSPKAALAVTPSTICAEQNSATVTFTGTVPSGATYTWDFDGGNASPGTGTGVQTITWQNGGVKTVTITVDNNGCKATASVQVVVYPRPPVFLTSTTDTICTGDPIGVAANPANYQNYHFYINGNSVQNSASNTYTPGSLNTGDIISVVVTDYYGCSSDGDDTIAITVSPKPQVTLSPGPTKTVCIGDSILFTATPSGLSSYTFYDNNTVVQTGSSNTWWYKNPVDGHIIKVIPSNGNCNGNDSAQTVVIVKDKLTTPQVNCGTSTPNSIQFTWAGISGATGYQVSINGGAWGAPSSGSTGTSHSITGLNPGDSATIQVIAIGNAPCGNSDTSVVVKCKAITCKAITFDYTPVYDVCNGSTATLSISNLSISDYAVSWNGNPHGTSLTYTLVPTGPTTITVTVKDSTSALTCPTASATFTVNVNPIPSVTLSVSEDTICANSSVTFTATPGTYDNYAFYNGTQLLQSGLSNVFTTSTLSSNVSITVIATLQNCTSAVSNAVPVVVVQPLQAPVINCGTTASSSISYTWNAVSGATGYQVSVNSGPFTTPSSGTAGTSHTISGLTKDTSFTIIVIALGPLPCGNSPMSQPATCFNIVCQPTTFSLTPSTGICPGDSVTVNITNINTNNFTIAWNGGSPGTVTSMTFKPTQTTTVAVAVKNLDQPDCPAAIQFMTITVNAKPQVAITASNDTICKGDAITFIASPGGYTTYTFYDAFAVLQNNSSNIYTTTSWVDGHSITCVATANGCKGDTSVAVPVVVNDKLNTPQVNCGISTNNSISFTWDTIPGATGYMVSVNGGPFTTPSSGITGLIHSINGLNMGDSATISVMAVGPAPCGNSSPSSVTTCYATPCTPVTYAISAYPAICSGDTITLSVTNISVPTYAISWEGGNPGTITTYTIAPTSNVNVSVAVIDTLQSSCKATVKTFVITVNPIPTATLTSTAVKDSLCAGSSITFTASPANYDVYTFMNGNATLQSGPNPSYSTSNLGAGNVITVTTQWKGCVSKSTSQTITIVPTPTVGITTNNDTICFGQPVTFTAVPSGLTSYEFYNGTINLQTSTTASLTTTTLPVGSSNSITVTGINSVGCKGKSTSVNVVVLALPTLTLTSSAVGTQICNGQLVTFTAAPAGLTNYQFFNGVASIQNGSSNTYVSTQITANDTIKVTGKGANGCVSSASNSLNFTVNPSAIPTLTSNVQGVCVGGTAALSATVDPQYTPVTYSWSNGATTTATSMAFNTPTWVYVTTLYNNCNAKDSVLIDVDNGTPPVAVASVSSATPCRGDSIQLTASGGLTYSWLPVTGLTYDTIANPKFKADNTITYTVTVKNKYCTDTEQVTVVVDKCLEDLPEPITNVISPNGDSDNENWVITDIDYFTNSKLTIFNRWGNIVYTAAPYQNTFNGKNNSGQDLPDGTYFYTLELGTISKTGKTPEPRTGFIIIHR